MTRDLGSWQSVLDEIPAFTGMTWVARGDPALVAVMFGLAVRLDRIDQLARIRSIDVKVRVA